MLRKVYLRYRGDHPYNVNTFAAYDGFWQMGVETAPFYGFGDIQHLQDLGPEVGLVGFVGDVWNALETMGKARPEPMDYPHELKPFLGREIWRSTLGQIRRTIDRVFIKPVQQKEFTGFVWQGSGNPMAIVSLENDTAIWVSECLDFQSEYRVFVQDGEIVGVKHYKGDWAKVPDRGVVERAVAAYKNARRAYTLDFGVTPEGTRLVEANDGYAVGGYGLDSTTYAKFIQARWEELAR
jgi:hypothetical protein